jgi:drug/metabolite transporter (DMT)-like permease
MPEGHKGSETCGPQAATVFIIGLAAGTGCTIASKALFEVEARGMTGEMETFDPPLFQTWVMFLGMMFALPAHFISEWYKGYKLQNEPVLLAELRAEQAKVTSRTYMLLAIPSVFDLLATVLMVFGLLHVNASIWMLLRGGGIVFVALMKNYILDDRLKPSMWLGVAIIGVAVAMVGYSSQLGHPRAESGKEDKAGAAEALVGVLMTLAGTFVQSVQYTYEEKVMSGNISAPPWLLIGMEGFCGTVLCTFLLYPLAWLVPGPDHGSFENPLNTYAMLQSSPAAVALSLTFCVLVFVLNSFSVLVTFMMSSVWHAILDNFRPLTIWVVELLLYYSFTHGRFGERWNTGSWLQLAGMAVLLVGTAIYNGSLKVPGFSGDDLVGKSSMMSSPALSRSPLMTMNTASAPLDARGASPYVSRVRLDDEPMLAGRATDLKAQLLPMHTRGSVPK